MDGIANILSNRDFDVPPEVLAIKTYVQRYYEQEVQVLVQPHTIVVKARSSALIGSLRLNAPDLQKAANTDKRITFRIG